MSLYLPTAKLTAYENIHRYGWNYVINNLYNLDVIAKPTDTYDPSTDTGLVLLDDYLDQTFGANLAANVANGTLPYTKKWIGFLHHTFDTDYSGNNLTAMFASDAFLNSLSHCQGLFTLTQVLQLQVSEALNNLAYSSIEYASFANIRVVSLVHPTGPPYDTFTMDNFINNQSQQMIQIGSWLRDCYAIYKFPDTSIFSIQKAILIGPNMADSVKPEDFFPVVQAWAASLTTTITEEEDDDFTFDIPICRDITSGLFSGNRYVQGAYELLIKNDSLVQVITQVDDAQYDIILSQNIVYIQLFDAGAVNTLIECIVRNTPILINPLPSVIELLGPNYPFYYDQNDPNVVNQSKFNLFSLRNIQNTTNYMNNLNKDIFYIDYFTDSFVNSSIIQNILEN